MKERTKYSFNRLILIGNGFDLAHGLKTSYNDFILWYLGRAMTYASIHRQYVDPLLIITYPDYYGLNRLNRQGLEKVSDFLNFFYERGLEGMILGSSFKIPGWDNTFYNPFEFELKSDLLSTLLSSCSNYNWVDIENTFYEHLKAILKSDQKIKKEEALIKLNSSLELIIQNLDEYLGTLDVMAKKADYDSIIFSDFNRDEFLGLTNEQAWNSMIGQTMILNFNYTSTINNYLNNQNINSFHLDINYIHGKIKDNENQPIFGFGDELDSDYASFELEKTKGIFKYIKSFWYFKTSNYHNLIRFIDSENFQVYILGHSCGLSDRTMLNMIFEHKNCRSIKIFYHQEEKGNNYIKLTQEISRHFRNKQEMRRKIVPFNMSSSMPQLKA